MRAPHVRPWPPGEREGKKKSISGISPLNNRPIFFIRGEKKGGRISEIGNQQRKQQTPNKASYLARPPGLPSLPPARRGNYGNTSPPINGQDRGADGRRRNSRQLPGALRPGRRLRPFTQSLACSAARRRGRLHDPRRASPESAAIRGAEADPLPRGGRRPPIRGPGWGARADRPRGSGGGIERRGEPSGGSGGRAKGSGSPRREAAPICRKRAAAAPHLRRSLCLLCM